jgi:adenine deaminase
MKISGQLVDIHKRDIYPAVLTISKGVIVSVVRVADAPDRFILPGFIDAHIHIESSMVTPGAFATTAIKHGTIGVVSDPHEIANVLGIDGVKFMMKDAGKVPLNFWFGAPSCVPATSFESSGARLGIDEVKYLLDFDEIKYLSEMMNFPGVIYGDKEVLAKIDYSLKMGKPVDGHAPGLSGELLGKYAKAGITTDHECSTIEEAKEKISLGMKILIREGSAARNLNALKSLFISDPDQVMLCSDDLHPEMLEKRHINKLVGGLISEGFDLYNVIRSTTINPVNHYGLEAGLLRAGDRADFIIVDNLKEMCVRETWINGKLVFQNGKVLFDYKPGRIVNKFKCNKIHINDLLVVNQHRNILVIEAFEGELLTKKIEFSPGDSEYISSDPNRDILKIVVKSRYGNSPAVVGFIKGFGLKKGAFASSIAHDSHNIICIGSNDQDMVTAMNEIILQKGGLAVSSEGRVESLALNIGGIMTSRSCEEVAVDYEKLSDFVKSLGSKMAAPFMTLSFMALLVIPELKIGDKGLFDVTKFDLVSLYI